MGIQLQYNKNLLLSNLQQSNYGIETIDVNDINEENNSYTDENENEYEDEELENKLFSNLDFSHISTILKNMKEEEEMIMYEGEEVSKTKFNLVICEPYNQYVYGNNEEKLNSEWIVISRFRYFKQNVIKRLINCHIWSNNQYNLWKKHPFISRYKDLCTNMKPQIAECIYLSSGECVCIIKTFWIKIIQRRWKKIFQEKKSINNNLFNILTNIYKFVINNNTSTKLAIHGMLSDL